MTERTDLPYPGNRVVAIKQKCFEVALVGEVDKIRQVVHFFPIGGLFSLPVFDQFLDLGFVVPHQFVTPHALAQGGDTGDLAAAGVGVAIETIDLVLLDMEIMGKFYGLGHRDAGMLTFRRGYLRG